MKRGSIKSLTVALIVALLPISASAAPAWCHGTMRDVWINEDGGVYINGSWRNAHTEICNVEGEWKGVSVETCQTWLSLAMAAKLSEAPVTVYYSDVPSCSQIATYGSAPNPGYLMLQ